jgi:hypothetical protein
LGEINASIRPLLVFVPFCENINIEKKKEETTSEQGITLWFGVGIGSK